MATNDPRGAPPESALPSVDLEALEKLLSKGTRAPWTESIMGVLGDGDLMYVAEHSERTGTPRPADAALIVALRNAAPSLIAELRARRAALTGQLQEAGAAPPAPRTLKEGPNVWIGYCDICNGQHCITLLEATGMDDIRRPHRHLPEKPFEPAAAPPSAPQEGLAEGVRKILYGGMIASIGLQFRYMREDFDKLVAALNDLPLPERPAAPPPSAEPAGNTTPPLCSTCGREREAQEAIFCSNAFHLAPRPWPTTPEEAADRVVGYCRHVTAAHSHDWACAMCIAYWIRFIDPAPRTAFPPHNHEPGGPIMSRCPACEAVKALLSGQPPARPPSPAVDAAPIEVEARDKQLFREGQEAARAEIEAAVSELEAPRNAEQYGMIHDVIKAARHGLLRQMLDSQDGDIDRILREREVVPVESDDRKTRSVEVTPGVVLKEGTAPALSLCEKDLQEDCGAPNGDVRQCQDDDCPLRRAGLRSPVRGEGRKICTRSPCKSQCAVLWCWRCGVGLCEKHCAETFSIACPHDPITVTAPIPEQQQSQSPTPTETARALNEEK